MPNFSLLPTGVTGTNNWTCSTGSDFVDLVDEDDDSTYIYETLQNGEINYTFADPSIAEGDMDFDEDVTVTAYVHAHYTFAAGTVDLGITTNGTDINLIEINRAIDDSAYPVYSGQSGTVKAFGTDWDYAGLQNLQMKLKCTDRVRRFEYLRVSYIFFRVDYTSTSAVTDNATFFGANF